jgi:hypothetical protein
MAAIPQWESPAEIGDGQGPRSRREKREPLRRHVGEQRLGRPLKTKQYEENDGDE